MGIFLIGNSPLCFSQPLSFSKGPESDVFEISPKWHIVKVHTTEDAYNCSLYIKDYDHKHGSKIQRDLREKEPQSNQLINCFAFYKRYKESIIRALKISQIRHLLVRLYFSKAFWVQVTENNLKNKWEFRLRLRAVL